MKDKIGNLINNLRAIEKAGFQEFARDDKNISAILEHVDSDLAVPKNAKEADIFNAKAEAQWENDQENECCDDYPIGHMCERYDIERDKDIEND